MVGFDEDGAKVGPNEVWRRVDSWGVVGGVGEEIVLRFFFFFFSSRNLSDTL